MGEEQWVTVDFNQFQVATIGRAGPERTSQSHPGAHLRDTPELEYNLPVPICQA